MIAKKVRKIETDRRKLIDKKNFGTERRMKLNKEKLGVPAPTKYNVKKYKIGPSIKMSSAKRFKTHKNQPRKSKSMKF